MSHYTRIVVSLAFLVSIAAACEGPAKRVSRERAEHLKGSGSVAFAAVWDISAGYFIEGVRLAISEQNEKGGVLGRPLKLVEYTEDVTGKTVQEVSEISRKIARQAAIDPEVVAVIGHTDSNSALGASVTYDAFDVFFFITSATNPSLTNHGFRYLFRTIQDDSDVGKAIARLCVDEGFKRVAVVYDLNLYGEGLSGAFYEEAVSEKSAIDVVLQKSISLSQMNFLPLISELKAAKLDAIVLATGFNSGATFLKQAYRMELDAHFVAGDGLYSPHLLDLVGSDAAEGLFIATSVDPGSWDAVDPDFLRRYRKTFGHEPDGWAVQGYDAVNLFIHAAERTGSFDREMIASVIRYLKNWKGVFGSYSFNHNGDVVGRPVYIKQIRNGKVVSHRQHMVDRVVDGEEGGGLEEPAMKEPASVPAPPKTSDLQLQFDGR